MDNAETNCGTVSANRPSSNRIHTQLLLRGNPSQPRKPWGGTEKEVARLQGTTQTPTGIVGSVEEE